MMKPKYMRKFTLGAGVCGLIVVMLGEYVFPNSIVKQIGVGIIFITVLAHIIFYRCPHCKRFLSRSKGRFCPYCGEDMDEE